MSVYQRIQAIIKRKEQEQSSTDFISDMNNEQPIKKCSDKLFKLIVKLEESKVRSRNEFPVQVRPRILIGNYVFASDQEFLRKSNIGLIISCLGASPVKTIQNVRYEKVNIKDQNGQDLLQHAQRVFDMIQDHLKNETTAIYIHCFHGKSRCVAVLLMYLIRKEEKNYEQLLSDIKQSYSIAQPNQYFLDSLNQYQETLTGNVNKSQKQQNNNHQHIDLLGFDMQSVYIASSNIQSQQNNQLDILQTNPDKKASSQNRQHLLIPQHLKSNSPQKLQDQYHLIQIDQDDQNAELI